MTGRKRWTYIDAINNILGNKPATSSPTVLDTTSDEVVSSKDINGGANDESFSPTNSTTYTTTSEYNESDQLIDTHIPFRLVHQNHL